jgi:hypothetical protein
MHPSSKRSPSTARIITFLDNVAIISHKHTCRLSQDPAAKDQPLEKKFGAGDLPDELQCSISMVLRVPTCKKRIHACNHVLTVYIWLVHMTFNFQTAKTRVLLCACRLATSFYYASVKDPIQAFAWLYKCLRDHTSVRVTIQVSA